MASLGPVDVKCRTCGSGYSLPLEAATTGIGRTELTLTLRIADADRALLAEWATSHHGPFST